MAKVYEVELPQGRKRPLKYTRTERKEIEERFDCDMRSFIYGEVFPLDAKGQPTFGGKLVPQIALLYYGLRHNGPKVTEKSIEEDVELLVTQGGSIYAPLVQAIAGVWGSGVLGRVFDVEEEAKSEGKDAAEASETSAST